MPLRLPQAVAPDVEPEGGAPLTLRLKLDLGTQDRLVTRRARPAASLARPQLGGPIEGQRVGIDLVTDHLGQRLRHGCALLENCLETSPRRVARQAYSEVGTLPDISIPRR